MESQRSEYGQQPGATPMRVQVARDALRAPADSERVPASPRKIAVLVCHGMGQQVAYETLDCVAKALHNRDTRKDGGKGPAVKTGFAWMNGKRFARADLDLLGADGERRHVHVYEGYWAPLMEGQLSARDVTRFLFGAGFAGLRYAWGGSFDRWMFGRCRKLAIAWTTYPLILTVFALVCAVLVLYTALGFVALARAGEMLLVRRGGEWPGAGLATTLANELVWSPLVLSLLITPAMLHARQKPTGGSHAQKGHRIMWVVVLLGAAWGIAWWLAPAAMALLNQAGVTLSPGVGTSLTFAAAAGVLALGFLPRREYTDATVPRARRGSGVMPGIMTLLAAAVVSWTIVSAVRIVAGTWGWVRDSTPPVDVASAWLARGPQFLLFVACSVVLCGVVRWFYIQYLGDVAAYVSSHTVNRFATVRERIRDVGRELAHAVYAERRKDGTGFEYDAVLVVGHSLGSVIAYDTLNEVLNESTEVGGLDAEARTLGLVTFGSPLDKTAFIFRTLLKNAEIREALAAGNQPLIQPPHTEGRRIRWINLYSLFDVVSGRLNFFDPERGDEPPKHRRVENYVDRDATFPLVAHTQYWNNQTLADVLYSLATGREPRVSAEEAGERSATSRPTTREPAAAEMAGA